MLKLAIIATVVFAIVSNVYGTHDSEYKLEVNRSNMGDQMNDRVLQMLIEAYMKDVPDKVGFLLKRLKREDRRAEWAVKIREEKLPEVDGAYGTFRINDYLIDIVGLNSKLALRALTDVSDDD